MSQWTVDVFTIGNLCFNRRSSGELEAIGREWDRRVPEDCYTLLIGLSDGEEASGALAWLAERKGLKVVCRGAGDKWPKPAGLHSSIQIMPRKGTRRFQALDLKGPGIIVLTVPSDSGEDISLEALLETLAEGEQIQEHKKDAHIVLLERSPAQNGEENELTKALDEADVKAVCFGRAEGDWRSIYQGRLGKTQYQSPDYRFACVDFLNQMPTRIGDIDNWSWGRKEKERVAETSLVWQKTENVPPTVSTALVLQRSTLNNHLLYQLDSPPSLENTNIFSQYDSLNLKRLHTLLAVLERIDDDQTIASLQEGRKAIYRRFYKELEHLPASYRVGQLILVLKRLLEAWEQAWVQTIFGLPRGYTISQLQESYPEIFEKLEDYCKGYDLTCSMDQVATDALGKSLAPSGLQPSLPETIAGLARAESKPSLYSLEEAMQTILEADIDRLEDCARLLVEFKELDIKQKPQQSFQSWGFC
jgi:predicted phosphohydrolase